MKTLPYKDLKEFDLVLFRPGGSNWLDKLVGKGICWVEAGMGCKSPEFCHVAVAMMKDGKLQLFQTNPPAPSYRSLDSVDWDNVVVMAFKDRVTDQQAQNAHWWADLRTLKNADPYGFPSIAGFLALGLLGRIWPAATRTIMKGRNPLASQSMEVCSQIVNDLFQDIFNLDILPDIGEGQEVPADLTGSVYHQWVYGRLGA